jgi:hypothetical protein
MKTAFSILALSFALLGSAACAGMPPDEAVTALRNPEADMRRKAADSLRTPTGVPQQAIRPLLEAATAEQEPRARAAMLITLGKSGVPEAKPLIDDYVMKASGEDARRWAGRALKYWMIENKQISGEQDFPDGWPYGTPGYPPK